MYLGRVWVVNPVEAARQVPTNPWEELAQQIMQRLLNDTLQTTLNIYGIEGPGSKGPIDGNASYTREYQRVWLRRHFADIFGVFLYFMSRRGIA